MDLIEKEYSYLFDFPHHYTVIAGFTKNRLKGNPPEDLPKALSFIDKKFYVSYMDQVHGPEIKVIDSPGQYRCDGLFTGSEDISLAVRTADCLPILFYSKKEGVIGAVHMGWRSAEKGILDNIPFDLASFIVLSGAGMRKCCYELGAEFLNYPTIRPFLGKRGAAYYLDPIAFAKQKLFRKGLKSENFFDVDICNHCSSNQFFSYRKTGMPDRTLTFILKMKNIAKTG